MYFQVCSNSADPQHLDERYRTSGPLILFAAEKIACRKTINLQVSNNDMP